MRQSSSGKTDTLYSGPRLIRMLVGSSALIGVLFGGAQSGLAASGSDETFAPTELYAGLAPTRMATNTQKTRLVISARKLGERQIVFQKESGRVVLRLGSLNLAQVDQEIRPRISDLEKYDFVRSVYSRWGEENGVYTSVIKFTRLESVESFILKPSADYQNYRLVIDFIHPQNSAPVGPQTDLSIAAATTERSTGSNREMDNLVGKLMQYTETDPIDSAPTSIRGAGEIDVLMSELDSAINKGRPLVITIDAGHGGKDPGALGRQDRHEKYYTLRYARALHKAINERPGLRAVLTRTNDRYLSLSERVRIADRVKSDLFISLHADSFPNKKAQGLSVYALSLKGASSKTAKLLAVNANSAIGFGGVRIAEHDHMVAATLVDLAQTSSIEHSLDFGRVLLGEMSSVHKLHSNTVQQANFAVLRTADYPAVLIELAFISNRQDERRLQSEWFQNQMIGRIINAIESFFLLNPPMGTYFALKK